MRQRGNISLPLRLLHPLAPTLKLIGNGLIMGANELLAETLTLGEKSGIGARTVHNLVKGMSIENSAAISDLAI